MPCCPPLLVGCACVFDCCKACPNFVRYACRLQVEPNTLQVALYIAEIALSIGFEKFVEIKCRMFLSYCKHYSDFLTKFEWWDDGSNRVWRSRYCPTAIATMQYFADNSSITLFRRSILRRFVSFSYYKMCSLCKNAHIIWLCAHILRNLLPFIRK